MAAYEFSDVACWEAVWQEFISEIGCSPARRVIGELQYWGRCIRQHAKRGPHFYPSCCVRLCHDECMAIAAVAAGQADDTFTGQLAAMSLTGCRTLDEAQEVWQASTHFGRSLSDHGLLLHAVTASVVNDIASRRRLTGSLQTARRD